MWTNPLLLSQAMDYLSGNLSVIMLKKNKQVSLNLVKGKTQRSQSESLSSHKRSRSASSHYPELSIIALNEHSGSSNANLCFSPPDYATPNLFTYTVLFSDICILTLCLCGKLCLPQKCVTDWVVMTSLCLFVTLWRVFKSRGQRLRSTSTTRVPVCAG